MGVLDDPETRGEVIKLAGQLAQLGLERYQGRRLEQAERQALLEAVREVEAGRVFTPTDEILDRAESEGEG